MKARGGLSWLAALALLSGALRVSLRSGVQRGPRLAALAQAAAALGVVARVRGSPVAAVVAVLLRRLLSASGGGGGDGGGGGRYALLDAVACAASAALFVGKRVRGGSRHHRKSFYSFHHFTWIRCIPNFETPQIVHASCSRVINPSEDLGANRQGIHRRRGRSVRSGGASGPRDGRPALPTSRSSHRPRAPRRVPPVTRPPQLQQVEGWGDRKQPRAPRRVPLRPRPLPVRLSGGRHRVGVLLLDLLDEAQHSRDRAL